MNFLRATISILLLVAVASESRPVLKFEDEEGGKASPQGAGPFLSGKKIPLVQLGKQATTVLDLISHDLARRNRLLRVSTSAEAGSITTDDRTNELDQFTAILWFGDPMRAQKVMFDTSSDLSWIRCDNSSAKTGEGVGYAPSDSKTSQLTACGSATCYMAGGYCADNYCSFSTRRYMDSSSTNGTVLTDTLTMAPSVSVSNFIFGCARTRGDTFGGGGADGLIGLGRGAMSLAQQINATRQYGFSYCIPSTNDNNNKGFISFRRMDEPSTDVTFTKMFRHRTHTSFYFVDLIDIYVGNVGIPMPADQETFVDSGTSLSYLPPQVHSQMTRIFRREFHGFLIPDNVSRFSGCFNFTGAPDRIYIPQITFSFKDGAEFNIGVDGTLYRPMEGQRIACLAFQPQQGISMIGRLAQQSVEVVYDTNNSELGFGAIGSC